MVLSWGEAFQLWNSNFALSVYLFLSLLLGSCWASVDSVAASFPSCIIGLLLQETVGCRGG